MPNGNENGNGDADITLYCTRETWPGEIKKFMNSFEEKVSKYGLSEAIQVMNASSYNLIMPLSDEEVDEKMASEKPEILDLKYFVQVYETGKEVMVLRESSIDHYKLLFEDEKIPLSKVDEKIISKVTILDADLHLKSFLDQGLDVTSDPILIREKGSEPILFKRKGKVKKYTYESEIPFLWYPKK